MGHVMVAFSGGVDSALLVKVAHEELGARAVALTADSPTFPPEERALAERIAADVGIEHILVRSSELEVEGYAANTGDRCYFCKSELFGLAKGRATELGIPWVLDGTIVDDLGGHRPGLVAAEEAQVRHPLVEAGMDKIAVRAAARSLGLPVWDKPSFACLGSRFPVGTRVTAPRVQQVQRVESFLRVLGFQQFRARWHELEGKPMVRIEVGEEEVARLLEPDLRSALTDVCTAEGFAWGVLVGSILGPFGMPLLGTLKMGLGWRLGLWLRHPDLRTYLVRTLPIMLGFSVVVVDDWILRRQGSMLPEGSISTLQYAKTLMKVPMGVFGLATGVAAYPTLSRLFGTGKHAEAHQVLDTALRRMLVLAFGAQVALTCAGTEIAALVYGNRLPPSQHEDIGMALGLFGIGLWAWAAQTVIARGFYAQGRTWLPTIVGSAVVVASYPFYAWMADNHGVLGLPVATSVAITVYVSVLHVLLRRGQPQTGPSFGHFMLRAGLAVAVGIGAGFALRQHMDLPSDLLQGGVLGLVSGLVYLAAAKLFAVPEVDEVIALVQRRLKR
jgi:uncharacterized protein (TIGR00268 family)